MNKLTWCLKLLCLNLGIFLFFSTTSFANSFFEKVFLELKQAIIEENSFLHFPTGFAPATNYSFNNELLAVPSCPFTCEAGEMKITFADAGWNGGAGWTDNAQTPQTYTNFDGQGNNVTVSFSGNSPSGSTPGPNVYTGNTQGCTEALRLTGSNGTTTVAQFPTETITFDNAVDFYKLYVGGMIQRNGSGEAEVSIVSFSNNGAIINPSGFTFTPLVAADVDYHIYNNEIYVFGTDQSTNGLLGIETNGILVDEIKWAVGEITDNSVTPDMYTYTGSANSQWISPFCYKIPCTNPVVSALAIQSSCTNGTPNADGYLQLSAVTAGDRVNFSTGSTYTGDTDYANATTIGALPFQFGNGLVNPSDSQNYTIRIFNGESACYSDTIVTLQEVFCNANCATNLLVNPDFELQNSNTPHSRYPDLRLNPSTWQGWTKIRNNGSLFPWYVLDNGASGDPPGHYNAQSGSKHFVGIGRESNNSNNGVSQTFAVTNGTNYTVSFYHAPGIKWDSVSTNWFEPPFAGEGWQVDVSGAASFSQLFPVDETDLDLTAGAINPTAWTQETFQFTATADGNATLSFVTTVPPSSISLYFLDNVSVCETPPCELSILRSQSENCSGDDTNGYTADWNMSISTISAPDNAISYQRNSETVQLHTLTGTTDTLTILGIPADGGIYDTLKIWFTNEPTCGDTVILKRPLPCPPTVPTDGTCATVGAEEIIGMVFEDWNYDGTMNQSDTVGVAGVQVDLYDDCGSVAQTTYTDANGNYQFTGLTTSTTYRVEFLLPESIACWAKPTQAGADNGTTVQFLQPGNCANLGLANPADYCQTNPFLVTACYVEYGSSSDTDVVVSFPFYIPSGTSTPADGGGTLNMHEAAASQLGAVYGLAYHRSSNTLFSSAYLKRHTAFGIADSPGAIYKMTNPQDGLTADAQLFVDLQALFGGTEFGINTHPIPANDFEVDSLSYGLIGKNSFGDLEISGDESTLWTINLHNRKLYKIPLGADSQNPVAPLSSSEILTYDLFDICDCDGDGFNDDVNDPDIRPFALKEKNGFVYIGVVCSAESTPTDYSKMSARAFRFDPIATTFTEVLQFDLNYNRGCSYSDDCNFQGTASVPVYYTSPNTANWRPWDNEFDIDELSYRVLATWSNAPFANNMYEAGYAQPLFSDIDFDENGNMYIGMRDRFGDMTGDGKPAPDSTIYFTTDGVGDIIRATPNGDSWTVSTVDITNGTEFFSEDSFGSQHLETSMGGIAYKMGSDSLAYTAMDPIQNVSAGVDWVNTNNGVNYNSYQVYRRERYFEHNTSTFGKANGLGDLELLCAMAPLEIGNYVWEDIDGDGIQDACEPALDSVIVTLYNTACEIVAIDTTDSNGQYYFNETKLREYTAQSDSILNPNTTYYVVITDAVGGAWTSADSTLSIGGNNYNLTVSNQGSNDLIDSDAIKGTSTSACNNVTDGYPFTTVTTGDAGCVDHNFDFGFKPKANYDYGDLPDIANGTTGINDYETYDSTGGPSHQIIAGLFLGDTVDIDTDGFPDAQALGDDNDGVDDEDGVSIFPTLTAVPGGIIRLPVKMTNTTGNMAYLEAWIDWNGDGDFLDANEMIVNVDNIGMGVFSTHVEIMIPDNALKGSKLGFRVRYSLTDNMTPYGRINSGEVEDYLLEIACPQANCLPIEYEIKRG